MPWRTPKNSKLIAQQEIGEPGIGEVISHVSANVGVIQGGTRPNMVPDYCEAIVDVRLPIGVDHEEIEEMVRTIIRESGETGIEYEAQWKSEGNYTDEDAAIVQTVKKSAEVLWGIDVIPAYQWASSDAREYRAQGIPTIQYGPSNTVSGYFFCAISQIACALDKCYNVKTDSRVAGWDGLYSLEWG